MPPWRISGLKRASQILWRHGTTPDDGDWDRVRDALEDNAWYPTLFSETEPMQDILGWELRIDSRSGLQRRRA